MLRRLGIATVTLLVAVGGLTGIGAAPAGAAPHTLTVTPSTGLSDGQTVTVTGTGYTEAPVISDWALTMCTPEILAGDLTLQHAIQVCAVGNPPFTLVPPSPDGVLTTSYTVTKEFSTNGGPVICGQAPDDCVILLAQLTADGFVGAGTPVSFGTPVPTLAGCIHEFLADHEHPPKAKLQRLLVCIFTVLTHDRR
jgi:hypothetical protein